MLQLPAHQPHFPGLQLERLQEKQSLRDFRGRLGGRCIALAGPRSPSRSNSPPVQFLAILLCRIVPYRIFILFLFCIFAF